MLHRFRILLIPALLACFIDSAPWAATPPVAIIETVASGLNTPWAIDFASYGRIFITERPGRETLPDDRGRAKIGCGPTTHLIERQDSAPQSERRHSGR